MRRRTQHTLVDLQGLAATSIRSMCATVEPTIDSMAAAVELAVDDIATAV